MKNNNDIDNILEKISIEPPSLDLENRIISAAFKRENQQISLLNIFIQLLAPKPVITYLFLLLCGLTIGLYAPAFYGHEQKTQEALLLASDLLFEEVDII